MALAPLRLSVLEDSPHYDPIFYHKSICVTLNGVRQREVITYDRVEGWLDRYEMAGSVPMVIDGEFCVERVRGVISAWIED